MTAFPVTGPQTITFTQTGVGLKEVSRGASQTLNFVQTQTRGLVLPTGITISENIESRRLVKTSKGRELTRMFFIKGTDDPVQADAFGPQVGDIYDDTDGNLEGTGFTDVNLILARRSLSPLNVGVGDSEKVITLEVVYGELDTNPSGVSRQVSLDISGQSVRVERAFSQKHFPSEQSEELIKKWGKDGLQIGPKTKETELKGVDRLNTAVSISETHERPRLTNSYISTLLSLHGKVNRNEFRGFVAGVVLFQGVRASTTTDGRWQLQYEFAIAPFPTVVTVKFANNVEEQIEVKGHEYFWTQWASEVDPEDSTKKINVTKSVAVATIFKDADFAALEIGTDPLD